MTQEHDRRQGPRRSDDEPEANRVRFDKTINLGHILTVASMLAALMVSWALMDKRVLVLEEARSAQRDRDQTQDMAARERLQEVRDALLDLRRSVEKLADKVGAK